MEGNGAIPPILSSSIYLHYLLLSPESELFHFKWSNLILITIVCFGKMSQNKFSVKCYDFYTLSATGNQLLDVICYQAKRAAFKFWLCVVPGGGEREMPDRLLKDFLFACCEHWL